MKNRKPRLHGMSSKQARKKKLGGHEKEKQFAKLIGGIQCTSSLKKDVIDTSGDIHSVKGGWRSQIILYSEQRFLNDVFQAKIARKMLRCLEIFKADKRDSSKARQAKLKRKLAPAMRSLRVFLSNKENKIKFIKWAFFSGDEVQYLTLHHRGRFHVFDARQAAVVICDRTYMRNSEIKKKNDFDAQKVVFQLIGGTMLGEVELRKKSLGRQVLFTMQKELLLKILKDRYEDVGVVTKKSISVYGNARKRFKKIIGELS